DRWQWRHVPADLRRTRPPGVPEPYDEVLIQPVSGKRGESPFSLLWAPLYIRRNDLRGKLRPPNLDDELRSAPRFRPAIHRPDHHRCAAHRPDLRPHPWAGAQDRGSRGTAARDEDHRGGEAAAAGEAATAAAEARSEERRVGK